MDQTSNPSQEKEKSSTPISGKKEDGIAILSYLGILFLIPLLVRRDDDFCQYHAKQGLILFIAELITCSIAWIPLLGWFIGLCAWIVWLVFSIIGIMNVLQGKKKLLPGIGQFAQKIDI